MTMRTRSGSGPVPRSAGGVQAARRNRVTLCILGRFGLEVDRRPVAVGVGGQRLLTLLAVKNDAVPRRQASAQLWPDVGSARASANLRSTLWRLQKCSGVIVDVSSREIRLAAGVEVDMHKVVAAAARLLDDPAPVDPAALRYALQCNLHQDIAPDLPDEEWLIGERERYRELRLRFIEALAEHLIAAGWYGAAVDCALGVTRVDPFREHGYQLLVRAHLAEGNQLEARRQYMAYRRLLRAELESEPSPGFSRLVAEGSPRRHPRNGIAAHQRVAAGKRRDRGTGRTRRWRAGGIGPPAA